MRASEPGDNIPDIRESRSGCVERAAGEATDCLAQAVRKPAIVPRLDYREGLRRAAGHRRARCERAHGVRERRR